MNSPEGMNQIDAPTVPGILAWLRAALSCWRTRAELHQRIALLEQEREHLHRVVTTCVDSLDALDWRRRRDSAVAKAVVDRIGEK